jgi:hypothetical protein
MTAAGGQLHNLGSFPVTSLQASWKKCRHVSVLHPTLMIGAYPSFGVLHDLNPQPWLPKASVYHSATSALIVLALG